MNIETTKKMKEPRDAEMRQLFENHWRNVLRERARNGAAGHRMRHTDLIMVYADGQCTITSTLEAQPEMSHAA